MVAGRGLKGRDFVPLGGQVFGGETVGGPDFQDPAFRPEELAQVPGVYMFGGPPVDVDRPVSFVVLGIIRVQVVLAQLQGQAAVLAPVAEIPGYRKYETLKPVLGLFHRQYRLQVNGVVIVVESTVSLAWRIAEGHSHQRVVVLAAADRTAWVKVPAQVLFRQHRQSGYSIHLSEAPEIVVQGPCAFQRQVGFTR